jgi:hypothetical protein
MTQAMLSIALRNAASKRRIDAPARWCVACAAESRGLMQTGVMNPGSCLCGALRFEAGPIDSLEHCHCSMCRRHHGSMFATFATAITRNFTWLAGEDEITNYRSSGRGRRPFCGNCGSVAPVVLPNWPDIVFVPAGNLEEDPGVRPSFHMFAASAPAWFPITDALPRYDTFPPEFSEGAVVEDPPALVARPGVVHGHCLCGAIAFELSGEPERLHNCHCSRCRRARGAAHATNAFFQRGQLNWLSGEGNIVNYKLPEAKRFGQAFCRDCGSTMPRVVASTGYVVAPCGSLDTPPGIPVQSHIFVGSKAPWHEITDQIPQWETLPA